MSSFLLFQLSLCFFALINLILAQTNHEQSGCADKCSNAREIIEISEEFNTHATFDVSELCLECDSQLKYYQVSDFRFYDDSEDTYTYIFNVYNTVLEWPPSNNVQGNISVSDMCAKRESCVVHHDNGSCIIKDVDSHLAYAYQLKFDETDTLVDCFPLSMSGYAPEYSFIDINDPSLGFIMTYTNGAWSGVCQTNRRFSLQFECNSLSKVDIPRYTRSTIDFRLDKDTPFSETVSESAELCDYKLIFSNIYGCPAECPALGSRLCNNFGLCGYDYTHKKPRCFCYAYQTGAACNVPDIAERFRPPVQRMPNTDSGTGTNPLFVKTFTFALENPATLAEEWHMPGLRTNPNFTQNEDTVPSVVYDLTPFVLNNDGGGHGHGYASPQSSEKFYHVTDRDGLRYDYYFNIFEKINADDLPLACSTAGNMSYLAPCDTTTATSPADCALASATAAERYGHAGNPAFGYVFQYDPVERQCWLLGTQFDAATDWTLYDAANPAKGTVFRYTDGGYCNSIHQNREFEIRLICPDDNLGYHSPKESTGGDASASASKVVRFEAYVEESDDHACSYYFNLETALACPYQCLTDNPITVEDTSDYGVCSNHGMCVTDPVVGYVRCLCDAGFGGDLCEKRVRTKHRKGAVTASNLLGYVTTIVILAVLLVALCYWGYKRLVKQNTQIKVLRKQLMNSQKGVDDVYADKEYEDAMNTKKSSKENTQGQRNSGGGGGKFVSGVKQIKDRIAGSVKSKNSKYSNFDDDYNSDDGNLIGGHNSSSSNNEDDADANDSEELGMRMTQNPNPNESGSAGKRYDINADPSLNSYTAETKSKRKKKKKKKKKKRESESTSGSDPQPQKHAFEIGSAGDDDDDDDDDDDTH